MLAPGVAHRTIRPRLPVRASRGRARRVLMLMMLVMLVSVIALVVVGGMEVRGRGGRVCCSDRQVGSRSRSLSNGGRG